MADGTLYDIERADGTRLGLRSLTATDACLVALLLDLPLDWRWVTVVRTQAEIREYLLRTLTPEEYERAPTLSRAAVRAAMRKGCEDLRRARSGGSRLPGRYR